MHELVILTSDGDETLTWDPVDQASTEQARAKFEELQKAGYEFFEAAETRGKRVTLFTPGLGRLIAAPGGRSAADKKAGKRERAMSGGPVTLPV
jgi:hypothetical protein